jgi:hypothetical protein
VYDLYTTAFRTFGSANDGSKGGGGSLVYNNHNAELKNSKQITKKLLYHRIHPNTTNRSVMYDLSNMDDSTILYHRGGGESERENHACMQSRPSGEARSSGSI